MKSSFFAIVLTVSVPGLLDDDDPRAAAPTTSALSNVDQDERQATAVSTPVPDLYGDWAKRAGPGMTDEELRAMVDKLRASAPKRDPFCPIARRDAAARRDERVLWESDKVMVLVDRFSPPDALVIPKDHIMFPTDTSPEFLKELAYVAAVTSDAFKLAADGSKNARIWINPPRAVSIGHLHVHVEPEMRRPTRQSSEVVYDTVAGHLGSVLRLPEPDVDQPSSVTTLTGIVRGGRLEILPEEGTKVRLTTIAPQEAVDPEAREILLDRLEGKVLRVDGIVQGGWVYLAVIRSSQYFRASVGMIIIDAAGRVLAVERCPEGSDRWQMPQGGLTEGEEPLRAAERELREELGLTGDDVQLVAEHPAWLAYELPEANRTAKHGRGQVQKWYLYRLATDEREVELPSEPSPELCDTKWTTLEQLAEETWAPRRRIYRELAHYFAEHVRE